MLTANTGINFFTGYQDLLSVKNEKVSSPDSSEGSTANSGSQEANRDETRDTVVLSRKARELQHDYQKKETVLEQTYTEKTQELEREYQQAKQNLESEYRQKKKSLEVNVYV